MNCFSSRPISGHTRSNPTIDEARRWVFTLLLSAVVACGGSASDTEAADDDREYASAYRVRPDPLTGLADVELQLSQSRYLLRELRFRVGDSRFDRFSGDGKITRDADILTWVPPERGGALRWQVAVPHRRNNGGHDAWLDKEWGLFRGEDIIPRAATRTMEGAKSRTSLEFELPRGWSVVTQYPDENGVFAISHPNRRFSQPAGWIVMGELGVRRDLIAGTQVTIAAPKDNGVRRLDMLALLNWTLPELARIVPELPRQLTIVSADEPMWRGGLSAPQSLYIHAQRPLISENGTSTLLHEIMHIALGLDAAAGSDWIIEGLAEYFGLELLRRSGTLSAPRYERARKAQKEWSRESDRLCGGASKGSTTAYAVVRFVALDEELRKKSNGRYKLDDIVIGLLAADEDVDLALLRETARNLIGENPDALHIDKLPGCLKMTAASNPS